VDIVVHQPDGVDELLKPLIPVYGSDDNADFIFRGEVQIPADLLIDPVIAIKAAVTYYHRLFDGIA